MVDHTLSDDSENGIGPGGPDEAKVFSGQGTPDFLAPVGSTFFSANGKTYKFVGPGATDWVSKGRGKTISGSFTNGNSNPYLSATGAVYSTVAQVLWTGSDTFGDVADIHILAATKATGKTAAMRIFDSTNSVVIAEVTPLNGVDFQNYLVPLLSVPSALGADWEIQLKRIDTGAEARISAILIEN